MAKLFDRLLAYLTAVYKFEIFIKVWKRKYCNWRVHRNCASNLIYKKDEFDEIICNALKRLNNPSKEIMRIILEGRIRYYILQCTEEEESVQKVYRRIYHCRRHYIKMLAEEGLIF